MKPRWIVFSWLVSAPLLAQPGSLYLASLVDVPIAKTCPAGNVATGLRLYSGGGVLANIAVGITNGFSIGISYGGSNLIGTGKPFMNPLPCVQARIVVFEEQMLSPAFLLGFDSQGLGGYQKSLKRYLIPSKGIYAVVSKNTSLLGGLGLHAGLNWSTDNVHSHLNFFFGCHKWIHRDVVAMLEYDAGRCDWPQTSDVQPQTGEVTTTSGRTQTGTKGLLNAGVRWSFAQRLFFEFAWKNLLEREDLPGSSREIKLVYMMEI